VLFVLNKKELSMQIISDIQLILRQTRWQAYQSVNQAMVQAYWLIGKRIVEEEQHGESKAAYGKGVIKNLSVVLQQEFGKGFSADNLEKMRKFYRVYPISETVSRKLEVPEFKLSWSHYQMLMRIDNPDERAFYAIESAQNNWSLRELKRQYDSALYMRLALSRDKEGIKKLSEVGQIVESAQDAIKDPYILEFLDLDMHFRYSESDLEQALIDKLEHFLLELGKGYTFVARQKRISFDERHYYIDLVFYNRLLRCFILIDLKLGDLKHQDIGQMQMYVNYYDRFVKLNDENQTIGIVLCQDKSETLIEITLPEDNQQIYASRYQTVLPSKEELHLLLSQHLN
jgi:predicted nuclease of restriction endonuclease-like (RecB) superfamily